LKGGQAEFSGKVDFLPIYSPSPTKWWFREKVDDKNIAVTDRDEHAMRPQRVVLLAASGVAVPS
jgi:hypothetical protein